MLMAASAIMWLLAFLQISIAHDGARLQDRLSDQQYQKALELRQSDHDASPKRLAQAATLLKAAAGLKISDPQQQGRPNLLLGDGKYAEILPGVEVAEATHPGAMQLLAEIYLSRGEGLPSKPTLAFALMQHAAKLGNPQAQREVGLWLATGMSAPASEFNSSDIFSLREPDIPRALVYLYQAATQNDSLAQLALGYRHAYGLGVLKSCSIAAAYYGAVAETVVKDVGSQKYSPFKTYRVDALGAKSGIFKVSRDQERLHYQWFADLGYVDAQRVMGRLLSQGTPEEARQALKYFRKAAEAGDADAQAYLGHQYANGVGVAASNESAVHWFRAGADGGSPSGQFGLGYMYLHGHGVPRDYRMALNYLKQASEKGHVEAWFHLGTMYLYGWFVPMSITQAQNYFSLAAKMGHILAQYNLAMTLLQNEESCELGLHRLKHVAESGPWISIPANAYNLYDTGDANKGDHERALLGYLRGSELGYEIAQLNAAWMISKGYGLPASAVQQLEGNITSRAVALALQSNQRASQQGNVDAMLSSADTYYYGRGIPRDLPMAFKLYSSAATHGRSAQAYFNLGYMHQMGVGVAFDAALAKRNYDKAVEMQNIASVPVKIALLSLRIQKWGQILLPLWLLRALLPYVDESELSRPAGTYLPKIGFNFGILETILDLKFWDPHGTLGEIYQTWESFALVVLSGALAYVLFKRHQIRAGPPRGMHQSARRNPPLSAQQVPQQGSAGLAAANETGPSTPSRDTESRQESGLEGARPREESREPVQQLDRVDSREMRRSSGQEELDVQPPGTVGKEEGSLASAQEEGSRSGDGPLANNKSPGEGNANAGHFQSSSPKAERTDAQH